VSILGSVLAWWLQISSFTQKQAGSIELVGGLNPAMRVVYKDLGTRDGSNFIGCGMSTSSTICFIFNCRWVSKQ
jgi:hypothetical protein